MVKWEDEIRLGPVGFGDFFHSLGEFAAMRRRVWDFMIFLALPFTVMVS